MKRMALLLCVLMLVGCVPTGDSSGVINNNGAKINNGEASLINTSLNLLKLEDIESGNTLISPVSIITALAMTGNGASGNSETNFNNFFGVNRDVLNNELKNLIGDMKSDKEGEKLNIANSIWYNKNTELKVKDTFLNTIRSVYQADIMGMNFLERESASAQINNWVADRTDRMIEKIIQPNHLSPDTQMILINSILFDYKWARQYEEYQVSEGKFNGQDETKEVQYLNSQENSFIETDDVLGAMKSYQGGRYHFIGLMPKDQSMSLYDFVQSLTQDKLEDIIDSEQNVKTNVKIPKFEYDYSTSLKDSLILLGLEDEFDGGKADFGNMYDLGDKGANVYINDVLHKTRIELNEAGTKAAAVTAVMVDATSADIGQPKEVHFDRPFLYIIYDGENKLPVFLGTIVNL
ncbi:MAG TPA: serpin family protein [Clostridia bacterium]|nr:serpin family protein [Clostridia bacterium]